jgi:hypothetical protein
VVYEVLFEVVNKENSCRAVLVVEDVDLRMNEMIITVPNDQVNMRWVVMIESPIRGDKVIMIILVVVLEIMIPPEPDEDRTMEEYRDPVVVDTRSNEILGWDFLDGILGEEDEKDHWNDGKRM